MNSLHFLPFARWKITLLFCTKTMNRQICGFHSVKSRSSLGQTRSRVKYFSWNYAIMAMTFGECNFFKYFTTMRNKILLLTIFHVSSQTVFEQGILSSIPRTSPGWRYASSYPPQRNSSLVEFNRMIHTVWIKCSYRRSTRPFGKVHGAVM